MVRGKVQLRQVENPVRRKITFCKRRAGLFKKAKELAVLCSAKIGVIIFSANGKLHELATNEDMQSLIDRYKDTMSGASENQPKVTEERTDMLKQQIRYMHGREEVSNMTFGELQYLEKSLEVWTHNIRLTKMQIISQQIERLKTQEGILQATNQILVEKIREQNWGLLGPNMIISATDPYPMNIAYNY